MEETIGDNIVEESIPLLTPFKLGPFQLSHRVVLGPLTRTRSITNVPQCHAIPYYAQRATKGGLLFSEGILISAAGHGSPITLGLHTEEHVEGWKPVVQAVHDVGGIFFAHLWHVTTRKTIIVENSIGPADRNWRLRGGAAELSEQEGQKGNKNFQGQLLHQLEGCQINKSSYVGDLEARQYTYNDIDGGKCQWNDYTEAEYCVPHQLTVEQIPKVIEDWCTGARNAIKAGFDGVELHGGHGYLLEQLSTNGFASSYGPHCLESRSRYVLELIDAVIKEVGADRVGIRLTPFSNYGLDSTSDPMELGLYLVEQLNKRNMLYVHVVEPGAYGNDSLSAYMEVITKEYSTTAFSNAFKGPYLTAGGFNRESGNAAIASGKADLVVYRCLRTA